MKKMISLVFIAFLSINAFAQDDMMEEETPKTDDVRLGVNIGTTSGDEMSRDRFSTNFTVDFTYLLPVTSNLKVGGHLAYTRLAINDNKTISTEFDEGFLSFSGTFRLYNDSGKFFIGSDFGYGYGLEDGGFLYRPRVGFQISECSGLNISYIDLNDTVKYNAVTIGYEFIF
ncbi:hypothetical protein [Olleya sp. YS]|uniref:hypothetical protein n=1 Tax=Olleya sp. YS TaxID=3028318 RepID=UPI00243423E2|nr:hypothetical protein [Olleya sp. YS]WGD34434.1 hypothetical protein Ollyesu_11665 [Olleya sp. YS]